MKGLLDVISLLYPIVHVVALRGPLLVNTVGKKNTTPARRIGTTVLPAAATDRNDRPSKTFQTALGIVPPDEVWDTIQRARYVAQDQSYTTWPPCLRLFHPFGTDIDSLAFAVAACIDEYEIESFEICLSEWSIIPHAEAMELQWWRTQRSSDPQQEHKEDDGSDEKYMTLQQREDKKQQQEYNAMVERLAKRGKIRQRERREKLGLEPLPELEDDYEENDETSMYQEFDGPCVLCLEPDLESRADLLTLRAILQQEAGMSPYSPFCPTATVDPSIPPVARFVDFRPIIPIASFGTVSQAIPVAQKLRKVWEPLTWEVTDLQILSSQAMEDETDEKASTTTEEDTLADPSLWLFRQKATKANHDDSVMMGCSSLIMLYGEEMKMDDELNQEIANMVAQKGEDGGFGRQEQSAADSGLANSTPTTSASSLIDGVEIQDDGTADIEAYLADEAEDASDEGTVVIIGRVHFFTGDARIYQGMPAASTRQETSTSTMRRPALTDTRTTEGTTVDDEKKK